MSESRVLLRNEAVLEAYGSPVLWDSRLDRIEIQGVFLEAAITLDFELIRHEPSRVRISFSGVHEFAFNHDSGLNFYYVHSLKFFAGPRGFYLSLDPSSEEQEIDPNDNDVIYCSTMEVLEIPDAS